MGLGLTYGLPRESSPCARPSGTRRRAGRRSRCQVPAIEKDTHKKIRTGEESIPYALGNPTDCRSRCRVPAIEDG